MCKLHETKERVCHVCIENLSSEKSIMTDRLWSRLDAIWESHPELREEMLELERLYPVTGIEVLAQYKFPDDFTQGEGYERAALKCVAHDMINGFLEHKPQRPGVSIGCDAQGFFIYCKRGVQ